MAIMRARHERRNGKPLRAADEPSAAQVDIFFATLLEDLSEYTARQAAKISRDQLAALKQQAPFLDRYEAIKEDLLDRVEDAGFRAAVRGDKDLIKFFLMAKRQSVYSAKPALALNVDVTKLSDEELDDLIAKHSKR